MSERQEEVMEFFRIGNISSETLLVKDNMNSPQSFYGGVWKFTKDKTQQEIAKTKQILEAQKKAEQGTNQNFSLNQPLDNALVDQAKAQGLIPDLKTPDAPPVGDGPTDVQSEGDFKAMIEKLSYPEIQTLAAAEGISNIAQKKQILIEKIIEARRR
jgi:hypothetical protein